MFGIQITRMEPDRQIENHHTAASGLAAVVGDTSRDDGLSIAATIDAVSGTVLIRRGAVTVLSITLPTIQR